MRPGISVIIPTIAPRSALLDRARTSATGQTLKPRAVIVSEDTDRLGAAATRHRGLMLADTEWVAFLDDDDMLLPQHLERLMACAEETGADYVYSWYEVIGGADPMPEVFGKPFDRANPVQTTVTTLVRTELAQSVGYYNHLYDNIATPDGNTAGEDWRFTLACLDAGAEIVHLPEKTWHWFHHGANTSGLPTRW